MGAIGNQKVSTTPAFSTFWKKRFLYLGGEQLFLSHRGQAFILSLDSCYTCRRFASLQLGPSWAALARTRTRASTITGISTRNMICTIRSTRTRTCTRTLNRTRTNAHARVGTRTRASTSTSDSTSTSTRTSTRTRIRARTRIRLRTRTGTRFAAKLTCTSLRTRTGVGTRFVHAHVLVRLLGLALVI